MRVTEDGRRWVGVREGEGERGREGEGERGREGERERGSERERERLNRSTNEIFEQKRKRDTSVNRNVEDTY